MKKISTLILVILTSLVLSACGGSSTGSTSDNRDTTVPSEKTLSWAAPATRTDGSYLPLTELQGYRIYYGTSSDNLNMLVDLNDDSITEFSIDTLPSGSYYFAVTAYDADGVESGYSNVVNKDV
ncbi:MAG: fibronectin type III domain-containing protein [Candidatus Thiodiazotropha sp. (ex Myrtea sp. 'scaly one' KF741663)]|nr:fibronectin type III domain-containing protein [Candidatus Thiodiazotropha sp. (ex Myrtea sp. 'scaly one' KF741663)]